MTIWWVCEVHDRKGRISPDQRCDWSLIYPTRDADCRMVQRRLVPVDALVLEKDLEPEFGDELVWPEWAILAIAELGERLESDYWGGIAPQILDALLAAQEEQET